MTSLPHPDATALVHSQQLIKQIRTEIAAAGGWIDFARYMHLALYAPGLGYYSGGAKKFGAAGDFVTAPEISPLFASTLARQISQILTAGASNILELGAGTGQLALELLQQLAAMELAGESQFPEHYFILEVSAQLREIQRIKLAQALPESIMRRVQWLNALPESFSGLILANEVLDALPVHVVSASKGKPYEQGVIWHEGRFAWHARPLSDAHLCALAERLGLGQQALADNYQTELCPAATGLVASLAQILQQGALLLIDYGFPRHEYYHAQRNQGTLICHYQHHVHDDPFVYPGLQDITAHVDFTGIAEAGVDHGLQLLGYCGQAQFLINCGITELLASVSAHDMAAYLPLVTQAQKLLSPAEMGELFKVIAFGKGCQVPLLGFSRGDKSHSL